MKAVTVAGGSSDDPEIEAGTTVLKAETQEASAEPTADNGGPEAAEGEPAGPATDTPRAEAEVRTEDQDTDATGGEPTADAGATGEAEVKSSGNAEAEAEATADALPEGGPAQGVESEAEAKDEAPAEAGAQTEDQDEDASGAEPAHGATAKDEAKDEAPAASEADAVAEASAQKEDQDKDAPEAEPTHDAKAKDEAKAKTPAKPDATTEAKADDAAESDATTEAPAKDQDKDAPEAEPTHDAKAEDEAKAKTPAKPDATTEAKADDAAESDATTKDQEKDAPEAEPAHDAKAKGEAKDRNPAKPAAAAARGVGAPGGAEGPQEVPGGDRAEPAAAADETQLIARPRPEAARPDAPRTAPSWARDVEADSERTSKFVALKDLEAVPAPTGPTAPRPPEAGPAPAAPLPPLDLLAELTNTPAPTETPRRTAVRRVKIWAPVLLLLVGAGAGAQLLRPLPAPQLVASATDRTLDGQFTIPWPAKGQGAVRVPGSGDLGTFGEQKPVPTASVAKVMTAYVILKDHPLRKTEPGPDITIDAKFVADGTSEHESRISGLAAGTKFSQQDMLKMLMIPSGNNAARLLARWDSGTDSEAAFVAKMNAAAKELGMDSTTYTDPSGLDAATVSTAADQLKLAEAVMKDETFRSIVALPNATIKGLSKRLENNNTLLTAQGLSIRGIKTGSSTPAGGTLMWAAYKSIGDETPLILGTLMDQRVDGPDEDGANSLKLVLANSRTIIEAVRTALASVPVIRKGDVVGHVDDGLGSRTPLVATKDLNVIGVPGQQLKLSLGPTAGAGPLPHSAKDGAEVALLTVGNGEGARSVPVAVKGNLAEPSFQTRLTRGR
ncbi:serine hydrolase [Streptomyces sp. NPDC090046]|uniref:D-alanyl-D-alanine carboxypeptidase family protein n=1 Tax=Streptomyces sp. NPDC090046 TaxID=3365928 RepID=UPI0038216A75